MGTFILPAATVQTSDYKIITVGTLLDAVNGKIIGGTASIASQIAPANGQCPPGTDTYFGPVPGFHVIDVFPGNNVFFDGSSTPTDLNSLPAGINMSGNVLLNFRSASFSPNCVVNAHGRYNLIPTTNIKPFIDGLTHSLGIGGSSNIVDLFTTPWGLEITYQAGSSTDLGCGVFFWNTIVIQFGAGIMSGPSLGGFSLTGGYSILGANWNLVNLTHPNNHIPLQIRAGDTLKLTANYDLSNVTEIDIGATALLAPFLVQTSTEIEVVVPDPPPTSSSSSPIQIVDFNGNTLAGYVNPITTNASGIYSIIPNKTHDTLYINSSSGNSTEDVAIPNPFFKTGFIGG